MWPPLLCFLCDCFGTAKRISGNFYYCLAYNCGFLSCAFLCLFCGCKANLSTQLQNTLGKARQCILHIIHSSATADEIDCTKHHGQSPQKTPRAEPAEPRGAKAHLPAMRVPPWHLCSKWSEGHSPSPPLPDAVVRILNPRLSPRSQPA